MKNKGKDFKKSRFRPKGYLYSALDGNGIIFSAS